MFRPWGQLSWVIGHCTPGQWSLLGCLGTERRSLAVWEELSGAGRLAYTHLLRVIDAPPRHRKVAPFAAERSARLAEREAEFLGAGGAAASIESHELLESHGTIVHAIEQFTLAATADVIVDVSSLPKRFFFPAVKLLLQKPGVRNLIITYTVPESYASTPLAFNHNDWAQLPLFAGTYLPSPAEMMIVGVGFEALGLPDQVEHGSGLPVKLLLPFPAQPSSFQRSWELVRKLQSHRSAESLRVYRVDAKSVSDCFDQLVTLSDGGQSIVELAPFGPKPTSVAMCLFAIATGCPVFYTQPTSYHPDYSVGISTIDGIPEIYAYCVRIDGRDVYSVP